MEVAELLLLLKGDASSAVRAIGEVGVGLDGVEGKAGRASSALKAIGAFVAVAATVGVAALGVMAYTGNMAAKFQADMTLIQTQAGATAQEVAFMGKAVMALAPTVGIGPDALAQGLYHVESLGYRGAQALNILTVSAKAAQLGQANLEEVTSALGAAVVTGISGVQNLSTAMGTLDATIGAGNMRMGELVAGLSTGVLPVFKNAKLTLTDYGAALATLTDNGMRADEASTRLRMTIALMDAPSGAAATSLKKIGLQAEDLGKAMVKGGPNGGLVGALQMLKDHLTKTFGPNAMKELDQYNQILGTEGPAAADKYAAASVGALQVITHAFGGGRSSAAIQTLLGQTDRVTQKFQQITEQAGGFDDKVATRMQNVTFKVDQLKAGFDAAAITLGDRFAPMLGKAADLASAFLGALAAGRDPLTAVAVALDHIVGPGVGDAFAEVVGFFNHIAYEVGPPLRDMLASVVSIFGKLLGHANNVAGTQADRPFIALHDALDKVSGSLRFVNEHFDQFYVAAKLVLAALVVSKAIDFATATWGIASAAYSAGANLVLFGAIAVRTAVYYVTLAAQAVWSAVTSAAAWVASAATAASAWAAYATAMVVGWVFMAGGAVASAVRAAAAWVSSAATAGAAWMAQAAAIILRYVFIGAEAIAQTAIVVAQWAIQTGALLLHNGALLLVRLATLTWAAAQWALNLALNANPVGLVILAIALLVAGIIWAYNNVGWFRGAVNWLWKELQILAGWFSDHVLPTIMQVFGWIRDNVFPIIGALANVYFKLLGTELNLAIAVFKDALTVIGLVWDKLKEFGSWVGSAWTAVANGLTGPLKAVGDLMNILNPFVKHSPSLVEYVQMGTELITRLYTGMAGDVGGAMKGLDKHVSLTGSADGIRAALQGVNRIGATAAGAAPGDQSVLTEIRDALRQLLPVEKEARDHLSSIAGEPSGFTSQAAALRTG